MNNKQNKIIKKESRLLLNSNIYAFTLAEVLITLAIIGVVAAMTIPVLIQKTNETQTISKVKKVYSALCGVYQQLIAENGDMASAINAAPDKWDFSTTFSPKMKILKICGANESIDTGCFPNAEYKYVNGAGTETNFATNGQPTLLTTDGTAYAFSLSNIDCDTHNSANTSSPLYNTCGSISVDIDGPNKGPTQWGRDLFNFIVTEKGVYPSGYDSTVNCWTGLSVGYNCAYRILTEDAINY